jgi:hypothetical protein
MFSRLWNRKVARLVRGLDDTRILLESYIRKKENTMNANKTIHEAMGLCWHDAGKQTQTMRNYGCIKCGSGFVTCSSAFPDYAEPVHYCALMDWMRERYRSQKLQTYCLDNEEDEPVDIEEWFLLTRQEQITLIAEAIEAGVLK